MVTLWRAYQYKVFTYALAPGVCAPKTGDAGELRHAGQCHNGQAISSPALFSCAMLPGLAVFYCYTCSLVPVAQEQEHKLSFDGRVCVLEQRLADLSYGDHEDYEFKRHRRMTDIGIVHLSRLAFIPFSRCRDGRCHIRIKCHIEGGHCIAYLARC